MNYCTTLKCSCATPVLHCLCVTLQTRVSATLQTCASATCLRGPCLLPLSQVTHGSGTPYICDSISPYDDDNNDDDGVHGNKKDECDDDEYEDQFNCPIESMSHSE